MNVYGLSRTRDGSGNIVGFHLCPYTMCLHTKIGGGWETMGVYIAEELDKP